MAQNVAQFHLNDEDTSLHTNIFNRDREIDELIDANAQMLYLARSLWIGGQCIPWGLLSSGARNGYRREIESLVKEVQQ
jgi:hypothetical protein